MATREQIGGKRLGGTGKGTTVNLPGNPKSNHDISEAFITSMAPGVAVPCYINHLTAGSSIDINLPDGSQIVRTLTPLQLPLYGSYNMRIDFFKAPSRLYNKVIYLDPEGSGKDLSKVFTPQMRLMGPNSRRGETHPELKQIHPTSLIKYLGISGLGTIRNGEGLLMDGNYRVVRDFDAQLLCMYYDLMRYYCNRQEENAYVIGRAPESEPVVMGLYTVSPSSNTIPSTPTFSSNDNLTWTQDSGWVVYPTNPLAIEGRKIDELWSGIRVELTCKGEVLTGRASDFFDLLRYGAEETVPIIEIGPAGYPVWLLNWKTDGLISISTSSASITNIKLEVIREQSNADEVRTISLIPFPLKNLEEFRERLLSAPSTEPFLIHKDSSLPYGMCMKESDDAAEPYQTDMAYPMSGLFIKTYEPDRFHSWLNTEWIDGENGIGALSSIDLSKTGNVLQVDHLHVAKLIYKMMQRIAISGGRLSDASRVLYGNSDRFIPKMPEYCGGASMEIVFDQVVSSAASGDQPLGSQGSLGHSKFQEGGRIRIKADEDWTTMVMGIVTITPRVIYSQGNRWFVNQKTLADYHNPTLDGIAWQDLSTEEMHAMDTTVGQTVDYNNPGKVTSFSAGKQPPWIEHMTSQDRAFGNFVAGGNTDMMVTDRRYELEQLTGRIKDLTTYIDPEKFNYPYTETDITGQNFTVILNFDVKHRFNGGAVQVPMV